MSKYVNRESYLRGIKGGFEKQASFLPALGQGLLRVGKPVASGLSSLGIGGGLGTGLMYGWTGYDVLKGNQSIGEAAGMIGGGHLTNTALSKYLPKDMKWRGGAQLLGNIGGSIAGQIGGGKILPWRFKKAVPSNEVPQNIPASYSNAEFKQRT